MGKDQAKSRKKYYDVIKLISIFIIVVTHYIAWFHEKYFEFFEAFPYAIVLKGVSGKLGVIILGQIMCAFAYKSSEKDGVKYFLSRYLYFVIAGTIVNILYLKTGLCDKEYDIISFLRCSFSLKADIFPTFWCMKSFLFACIVAYENGQNKVRSGIIIVEIMLFCLAGNMWTALCLMGNLAFSLSERECIKRITGKRTVRVIILIIIFFAIKRSENDITYYIDGICTLFFILVLESSSSLQNFLNKRKVMAFLGQYTMPIFMIHNAVFLLISSRLFSADVLQNMEYAESFLIIFVLSIALIIFLSIPIQHILDWMIKKTRKIYDYIGVLNIQRG